MHERPLFNPPTAQPSLDCGGNCSRIESRSRYPEERDTTSRGGVVLRPGPGLLLLSQQVEGQTLAAIPHGGMDMKAVAAAS